MTRKNFHIATMPASRPADYCLGYFDDAVFLDFDIYHKHKIRLKRISFDGYGCCTLGSSSIPLNDKDSRFFKDIIESGIQDQKALMKIVKKIITLNKDLIWQDALRDYHLI